MKGLLGELFAFGWGELAELGVAEGLFVGVGAIVAGFFGGRAVVAIGDRQAEQSRQVLAGSGRFIEMAEALPQGAESFRWRLRFHRR